MTFPKLPKGLRKAALKGMLAVKKKSPEILTCLGISGMITTTVLAVKATPEAVRRIEAKKDEVGCEKLTTVQTVQAAGSCYIPAALTGAASIACLIGAKTVTGRRNAALATAYSLAENSLREYKAKVIETIGEEQEAEIQKKVWRERAEKSTPPETQDAVCADGFHHELCYDAMFGRYFYSDRAEIERAANNKNRDMTYGSEPYVSLNDFYGDLNVSPVEIGDMVGWNIARGFIKPVFDSMLMDGHKPILVLSYEKPPVYDFEYIG